MISFNHSLSKIYTIPGVMEVSVVGLVTNRTR
jgi:hypothetical protein